MLKMFKAINWPSQAKFARLVLVWLVVGLVLSACDDGRSAADVDHSIKTALVITNSTPAPTLVPGSDVGLTLVIYGLRDYYPANPDEQISIGVINGNARSFYISNCDALVLQRNDNNNWIDIAPGQPCPPRGGQIYQVKPASPISADLTFHKTAPYRGQSWNIPGTYRLLLTYYLNCPSASQFIADCIQPNRYPSDEFQLRAGTTLTILPSLPPAIKATVATPPTPVSGTNGQ